MEERLRDYYNVFNNICLISITDLNGVIKYANPKFCEVSKYSYDELVGNTHQIINSGFHPKITFEKMWLTIKSGNTWSGEIKNRAKDGSYYWVYATIQPIFDDYHNLIEYFSTRILISDKKELEEENLQNKYNLKVIFDSSKSASYLIDYNYKILEINKFARDEIKRIWKKDVKIGDSILEYIQLSNINSFKKNFSECFHENKLISYQKEVLHVNREVRFYEFSYRKVVNPYNDKFLGILFKGEDVTERMASVAKIKSQNQRLHDIAFISSHIIRKPVANILGLVELFDYTNQNFSFNIDLIEKIKFCSDELDKVIVRMAEISSEYNQILKESQD